MQTISASVQKAAAVTPNDATVVSMDALWVGTGGNISIDFNDGSPSVIFLNVPSGVFLEVAGCIVRATGTTATDLVACQWNRK